MAERVLREKSKNFAKQIVFNCRKIKTEQHETVLANQLLRGGTSIGANIHEAQYAQGTKNFVSKLEIALKECEESEYWLDLLQNGLSCRGVVSSSQSRLRSNSAYADFISNDGEEEQRSIGV